MSKWLSTLGALIVGARNASAEQPLPIVSAPLRAAPPPQCAARADDSRSDTGIDYHRALGRVAAVLDGRGALDQPHRKKGRHRCRAIFPRSLLHRDPAVCVSSEPSLLRAGAALAPGREAELDIGRA